jgi:hypothetical protein
MPTLRLVAALLAAATPVALAPAALAQGRPVDEGTFLVSRPGMPAQTESFKIWRLEGGMLLATSSRVAGGQRMTSSLRTDSLGTPIAYTMTVRENGADRTRITAETHGGRFQSHTLDAHGDESMHEYPVIEGDALVLEDDLVHQLYFATLAKRTGTVHVINPRAQRGGTATLAALGLEPIEAGGRTVTAAHYSLSTASGRRDFWVDSAGRLLRAEGPGTGLRAVREELPR